MRPAPGLGFGFRWTERCETIAKGDALCVAGTARKWLEKIERDFLPAGFDHLLVTFADPFLIESWAGTTIDGLPTLEEQIRLFHTGVMSAFEADGAASSGQTPAG